MQALKGAPLKLTFHSSRGLRDRTASLKTQPHRGPFVFFRTFFFASRIQSISCKRLDSTKHFQAVFGAGGGNARRSEEKIMVSGRRNFPPLLVIFPFRVSILKESFKKKIITVASPRPSRASKLTSGRWMRGRSRCSERLNHGSGTTRAASPHCAASG